jgi:hypothetical protein
MSWGNYGAERSNFNLLDFFRVGAGVFAPLYLQALTCGKNTAQKGRL